MEITQESVAAFKKILMNPSENGFDFVPMDNAFVSSDVATPKDVLFRQYIDLIKVPLPKVFFYIIMDEMHPQVKAPNGNLGWNIKICDAPKGEQPISK